MSDKKLTLREAYILVSYFREGMPKETIAKKLGITKESVDRAVTKLERLRHEAG